MLQKLVSKKVKKKLKIKNYEEKLKFINGFYTKKSMNRRKIITGRYMIFHLFLKN